MDQVRVELLKCLVFCCLRQLKLYRSKAIVRVTTKISEFALAPWSLRFECKSLATFVAIGVALLLLDTRVINFRSFRPQGTLLRSTPLSLLFVTLFSQVNRLFFLVSDISIIMFLCSRFFSDFSLVDCLNWFQHWRFRSWQNF